MNAEIFATTGDLLAAVFNGAYQGVILTLLVYLVLRLIGPMNAATRYGIWGATLVLVVALIPAHYCRNRLFPDLSSLIFHVPPKQPTLDTAPARPFEPATPEVVDLDKTAWIEQRLPSLEDQGALLQEKVTSAILLDEPEALIDSSASIVPGPGNDASDSSVASAGQGVATMSTSEMVSLKKDKTGWRVWSLERMLNPISWNIKSFSQFPKVASLALLLTGLSVALYKAGLLCGRLYQIKKVKKTAFPAGPELTGLFARLRADLKVRRNVELKLCPVQASPVALGFFNPLILLPEEYAHSPEAPETEHILRHELAHVRRRDDWANLAQHFLQAGLFFHPAVWWISKRLTLEREIACDDYVLQRGAGPRAYALLLANLAGRLKRHDFVFAQGVSSSKSQLQQRINMILNTRRNTSPGLAKARLGFVTASAALVALLALYSAPRVVLAQPPTAAAPVADALPAPAVAAIAGTAPVAIVASADEPDPAPAPPTPSDIGPGPKFKPGTPGAAALPPVPAAPSISVVPVTPVAPSIEIAADVHPKPFPHPPGTPSPDGSLEERIERLEQMVQSLMEQQKRHGAFVLRGKGGGDLFVDQKEMEKMNEKINEMAKKHAELAEQQAKHAAEMAERANKDFNFKWKAEAEQREKGRKDGVEKQLEALRKAREGLERQMQNLDRQIERVERDQERMQQDQERRSELQEEEPKEETASVAESAESEEN